MNGRQLAGSSRRFTLQFQQSWPLGNIFVASQHGKGMNAVERVDGEAHQN